MPGSKTYTSNKWVELIEADIEEKFWQSTHPGIVDRFGNAIIETVKIAASAIVSIYMQLVNNRIDDAIWQASIEEQISILAKKSICVVAIFAVAYIVITILHAVLKFVFDALLNIRMLPGKRKAAKNHFHRVTTNYIMLAMSFENKMREYIKRIESMALRRHCWSSNNVANLETYIEIVCGYYAEAVHYIGLAIEELQKDIPQIASFGFRQRWNDQYTKFIGLDYLLNSIMMLKSTINRMQIATSKMHDVIEETGKHTEHSHRLDDIYIFKRRLDNSDVQLGKLEERLHDYRNVE